MSKTAEAERRYQLTLGQEIEPAQKPTDVGVWGQADSQSFGADRGKKEKTYESVRRAEIKTGSALQWRLSKST